MMNATLKSMLLVLGAVSLGGLVVLKNAHAGLSTLSPSAEEGSSSVDLADKHDGGSMELGHKDGGAVELGHKDGGSMELGHKDGGVVELVEKADGGGWVQLADKHDAGASLELAGKGDGGGWITLAH
jgi:hypothetical protein